MSAKRRNLAALVATVAVVWHLISVLAPAWVTVGTKPSRGRDFATYYYACRVAAEGGDPYVRGQLGQAARADGSRRGVHPFLYPPPFLLLMAWSLPMDLLTAEPVDVSQCYLDQATVLNDEGCDIFLVETCASVAFASAAVAACRTADPAKELWVSFTLQNTEAKVNVKL